MSVIGFDIGNESCAIAVAKRGGVDVLLNDESKRETPAVVSFGEKQRCLGSAGAAFATSNPKSTIPQIKRLIGKVYKEVEEELKMLPFVTSEGPRGGILIELEYLKKKWAFTPVEILGMLFKHLKHIAEKNLESSVVDCVIGIPSYFTDLQRRLYLDAAHIAGLTPLRLMHDGTATALGYGMYKTDLSNSRPTNVMFVDIGHCDTQVTVASFEQGGMKILSHSFDPNLGGRDFDEVLFKHFAAQFNEKYKIDVHSNARASVRLRVSCEKVKKVLSANAEAPLSIECLIGDTDVRGIITREEFENLSSKLLERVIVPCKMALKDSGLSVDELYTIELVGSGSRVPAITRTLTLFLKKEPTRTLNASECVARGCALLCAKLSPTLIVRDYKITESFPYSIVIPSPQGECVTMVFPKGSLFPKQETMKHTGNTQFRFQVAYIKERDFPAGISHIVGHFGIGPFETSGAEKVEVQFKLKLNGHGIVEIISATILEDRRNNAWKRILMGDMGDSDMLNLPTSGNVDVSTTVDELHEAKEKEKMLTEQDVKVEETKDLRNTLESFVYDTRSKLSGAYQSFATDSEKEVLTNNLQETEDWLYEDSDDESEQDYAGKLEDLKKLLEPIENRYMEENAIAKATKTLQACIAKYRSHADSLSADKKDNVKDVCTEAEQWLGGLSQKQLPPKTLLTDINRVVELVERKCNNIIRSQSSPSRHEKPVDSDQRDQTAESDHPVDSETAIAKATKTLQACIAKYRSHADSLSAIRKDNVKNLCTGAEEWISNFSKKHSSPKTLLAEINRVTEMVDRKCKNIIRFDSSSSRHEKPMDSNQRGQTSESNQPVDFENAMLKAAKPLQACIAHYCSLAETLPADKKEKVINECIRAEKWLNNHFQNHASPKTLSTDIDRIIEIVESNCDIIINSKPSSPRHEEPVDLDQRAHAVESDQNVGPKNAMAKVANPLQACIAHYCLLAETLPADKKEKIMNVCIKAEQWLNGRPRKTWSTDINHAIEVVESKYERIINAKPSSPKHEEPKYSDQRDQPVDSNQMDQPADFENAMAKALTPLQACIAHYSSLAESQSADKKEKIMNVFHKADKWLNGRPRKTLLFDINQAIEYVESNCEIIINSKPPSPKHDEPKDSDQRVRRVDSDQRDRPMDADERDQPMDMDQTNQPSNSDQGNEPMDTDQRDAHIDSQVQK